jgi:hypothetical protein
MAVRVRDGQRLLIEIPAMSRQDSRTCTSQDQDAKMGRDAADERLWA